MRTTFHEKRCVPPHLRTKMTMAGRCFFGLFMMVNSRDCNLNCMLLPVCLWDPPHYSLRHVTFFTTRRRSQKPTEVVEQSSIHHIFIRILSLFVLQSVVIGREHYSQKNKLKVHLPTTCTSQKFVEHFVTRG